MLLLRGRRGRSAVECRFFVHHDNVVVVSVRFVPIHSTLDTKKIVCDILFSSSSACGSRSFPQTIFLHRRYCCSYLQTSLFRLVVRVVIVFSLVILYVPTTAGVAGDEFDLFYNSSRLGYPLRSWSSFFIIGRIIFGILIGIIIILANLVYCGCSSHKSKQS